MKLKLLSAFSAVILLSSTILPNGLSLNSIGPRAFGMGGAFVGLASDYSAIYWNPAGLALLKGNYVTVFATDVIPVSTYTYDPAHIDAESEANHYISPNFMGYMSFNPDPKLTIGLGVYIPAGIGTEWNGDDLTAFSGGTSVEWMTKIGVINFSPVIAYSFNENFSIGAAFNLYYGMFDLKRPGGGGAQYSEESDGIGYGATFGALYKINKMFSIGASFRTKSTVEMSGTAKNPALAPAGAPESEFDRDVSWPMWVAGGIAFTPFDKLTFTLDAQYSQWSESEDVLVTEFKNDTWKTVVGENGNFILHWEDATQIRFGAEYTLTENLALRAGYYNDPAPAPDETYNILFPSVTYNAVTIGAGYKVSNFTIDAGLEYLIGTERVITASEDNMPGTHNTNITAFTIGLGYAF